MAIHAYNTMGRKVEPLEPISPGKMGIYVCGPTVYDDPHLGHARSAVVFDVIVRYFRARGFKVTYVRNITDVDDKIIAKARLQNQGFKTLGRYFTRRYHEAMQRLNVQPPDAEPKATDHIRSMQDFIAKLIQAGHAYLTGDNVYFAVETFKKYGRLSGRSVQSSAIPAENACTNAKKHPADFALWKSAKPGEPSWPSPWGPGRPGWHIECSAMSAHLLGEAYDIHGGGMDLVFPHHENEIAQSESLFGKPPANSWIHNGLVFIEGEKMSKSLGNALRLHDLLERYPPEALRFFLLSKQYRHPIEFSHPALQEASARWARLHQFFPGNAHTAAESDQTAPRRGVLWNRFCRAMDSDFNFPMALSVVFEGIRHVNRTAGNRPNSMDDAPSSGRADLVSDIFFVCRKVLGIAVEPPAENSTLSFTRWMSCNSTRKIKGGTL
jgi:cysteinyl-tRNA synthetase